MKYYWTRLLPSYPVTLAYMLQASEYDTKGYLTWVHRTPDFRRVMKRRSVEYTTKIRLIVTILWLIGILTALAAAAIIWYMYAAGQYAAAVLVGLLFIVLMPWLQAYLIAVPLWIGTILVQRPRERRLLAAAESILRSHPGRKIAIAGSYGKTTAKEVLVTMLREGLKVAATPGNMNTPIGISRFASTLQGNEDVLIFEFGESHVGDIRKLCELVHPDMGMITGANEAHLSSFKTLERTVGTIFELEDFLEDKPLYKNRESKLVRGRIRDRDRLAYDRDGVDDWQVTATRVNVDGTSFTLKKGSRIISARAGLLGLHTIGVIAASVAVAETLGLTDTQIEAGIAKMKPFEHRMEPRLLYGAWIIDDTCNGNSEGVEAGLTLLGQLEAPRRIYVTPGLVEQGDKTQEIHETIGRHIAKVADIVVLMRNSVTGHILKGLEEAGYLGKITIIDDPLTFYTNLEHFVVVGDVVLMQNDWTDNYE